MRILYSFKISELNLIINELVDDNVSDDKPKNEKYFWILKDEILTFISRNGKKRILKSLKEGIIEIDIENLLFYCNEKYYSMIDLKK
jgi:transcription initiation factor IIE alpha subunit